MGGGREVAVEVFIEVVGVEVVGVLVPGVGEIFVLVV